MQHITLPTPDDFHIHLRDGEALQRTVYDVSQQCARALIMPNLTPAVDSIAAATAYKERILAHIPADKNLTPLMTLYLSDSLSIETVLTAKAAGIVAIKWYPKGATTNSAQGIANVAALNPILDAMQQENLLLLIHGEVTTDGIDIFDREATFIDTVLDPLRKRFSKLRIVLEHITTAHAVSYIQKQKNNLAATITAHHLLYNRNALLVGGIKPHYYCLPILKTEKDRQALLSAIASGDSRFFMGTDSAPHPQHTKENACGCAGCYTGHATLPFYAAAFEQADALDKLPAFASRHGADYYGLPYNAGEITLERHEQTFPQTLSYGNDTLIPFLAGQTWPWRLAE
ncbi:MAG: dihydroorotase [Cardiobacteriaceae bacterium]|nr:dihydroorotase [Cardiobacteriaceae bacterium]